MLAIIDYGVGNIASVKNMLAKIGAESKIVSSKNDLITANKIILPGVGAFDKGIQGLQERNLFNAIKEKVFSGIPILGICLGMQLLANRSEEGVLQGFGFFDAEFCHFSKMNIAGLKVPHVGWNNVLTEKCNLLIPSSSIENRYYFTHSYYAVCKDKSDIIGTAFYGERFPVAINKRNIYGIQFHPEKSHRFGMQLFKNFLEI